MDIRSILNIINEASYDQMVKNMYAALPDQVNEVKTNLQWAKQVLKKDERIVWFLRILQAYLNKDPKLATFLGTYQLNDLNSFKNELGHFFGINYDKIQNYQFQRKLVSEVFDELSALEDEFNSKQQTSKPVTPQRGDYELFKFPGGYAWWFVDRAYCPEEGRSGAHCGNVTGQYRHNQRILSFRKDGHVLMTFILEPDGSLGEMKAKHNQKPPAEFHPQIVKLLTWDKIQTIGDTTHQYRPDVNFNIFDLDTKYINYLYRAKPNLVLSQIKVSPIALLGADQTIQDLLWKQAVKLSPELALAKQNTPESWQKAIKRNPKMIMYAPTDLPEYTYTLAKLANDSSNTGVYLYNLPRRVAENRKIMSDVIERSWPLLAQVLPTNILFDYLCKIAIDQHANAMLLIEQHNITQELADYFFKKHPDDTYVGMNYIPSGLLPENYFENVVKNSPHKLIDLKERNLATPQIYLAAVSGDKASEALDFIPEKYKTDELLFTALKHDGRTIWRKETEKFPPMQVIKLAIKAPNFRLDWLASDHLFKGKKDRAYYNFLLDAGVFVKIPEEMYDRELAYKQAEIGNVQDIPEKFIDQHVVDVALNNGSSAMFDRAPKELLTPENVSGFVRSLAKRFNYDVPSQEFIDSFTKELPDSIRDKTVKLLMSNGDTVAESVAAIKRLAGIVGK